MSGIDLEVDGKDEARGRAKRSPQQKTQVDKLVDALKAGKGLTPQEQQLIDTFRAGFGLSEADPLWLMILPSLLRGGSSDAGEIREIIQQALVQAQSAGVKNNNLAPRFDQLEEVTSELRESVNAALGAKLEMRVQRGVAAALSDQGGGEQQREVLKAVRSAVVEGFERLVPAGWLVAIGALALAVALGFVAGIFTNKSGYEKYVAELEGKVAGYQSVIQQQEKKGSR
jgi:hypothetical protein